MFQQFYEPHPVLKQFVNNIMIHHVVFDPARPKPNFSIPPLPEHSLFFYVRDSSEAQDIETKKKQKQASSIIVGPNIVRHIITPGLDHLMIKVGFQPGGLYRLLGIPMNELLSNDPFDSIDFFGSEMKEVNEKLNHAISYLEMKSIIENFLIIRANKLKQALTIDHVLPLLIRERGLLKVDKLASQACLSIRQFERVFQQRIGLPPKHFSRMVRFASAWIMKEQTPGVSWVKIAYECGYFDQMHLIRDFHEFAGANPSEIEAELSRSHSKFFNRLFS